MGTFSHTRTGIKVGFVDTQASLENLIETGLLKFESLHPGGLEHLIRSWMKDGRRELGWIRQWILVWEILRRWGIRGLWRILRSERVFSSRHLGYGIVAGMKR